MNLQKVINGFLSHPVKVFVMDPRSNIPRHVFVYLGDVPKNVRDAAMKLSGKPSRDVESTLKSFYGADWRKKLAVEYVDNPTHKAKIHGGSEGPDDESRPDLGVLAVGGAEDAPAEPANGNALDLDISDEDMDLVRPRKKNLAINSGMTGIKGMNIDDIDISDDDLSVSKGRAARVTIGEDVTLRIAFEPGVTYVDDTFVYPEDKFSELKDKIYLSTGIPNYRQHMYWSTGGRLQMPYRLYAEGVYSIDIHATFEQESTQQLFGIPIDKNLYILRDDIKVEALDTFRTLGDTMLADNTVYVVDIDQFVDPVRSQLIEIIGDSYQFDLLYFGFVLKFWPQFTKECFHDYVTNEKELYQKFPDFAKSQTFLQNLYKNEAQIINRNYKTINKVLDLVKTPRSPINLAITHMTATTVWEKNIVNLRNLFDKLQVSRCHPEIYAYVDHEGKKYLLRKRFSRNESDINFPPIFKTGLIIAISLRKHDQESYHKRESKETVESEQSRYMFLNVRANGRYYVKSIWNEEEEYGFDEILAIMKKFVDPLINQINSMGKYVFPIDKPLPIMTKSNIVYDNLSISLYWKKILSSSMFKFVKTLFEEYIYGGIVSVKGLQQLGQFELVFRKGMTEFDPGQIERVISMANIETISNHYAYLSNNTVKQKWDQLYDGRVIKLHHRTTDLKFEVINIKEKEFTILYQYMAVFIFRAMCNEKLKLLANRPTGDVKKLRKLKEIDPELYNLKKYGSKKVYSIICQNPNQPVIYTDDEIKDMSNEQRKKLVKYWNFTLQRETFYGCPNKKYPHLSFKVGVHPKGYCLPCCKKSESSSESKKARVNEICLKKHIWTEGEVTDEADNNVSRHIINYGKDLDLGRLSKLPSTSVSSLLANTLESPEYNYYLYGVAQNFPAADNVGVLYCIAEALQVSPVEVVKKCIDYVNKHKEQLFVSLLNGALVEHFADVKTFLSVLNDIFVNQKSMVLGHRFTQWEDLFTELSMMMYGLYVIMFVDEMGHGEHTYLYVSERTRQLIIQGGQPDSRYLLVMKRAQLYYPIFVVNTEVYFKTLDIHKRVLIGKDTIIRHIHSIVATHQDKSIQSKAGRSLDLTLVKNFSTKGNRYRIVHKYVNKRNVCYGVLLETAGEFVYFPIEYVVNVADGLPVDFDVYDAQKHPVKWSTLQRAFADLNEYITSTHRNYALVTPKTILYRRDKVVGVRTVDSPAIFYISVEDKPSGLPRGELRYDYNEVNAVIMSRVAPVADNRHKLLGPSLYNNYLYQLFMLEFINHTEKERNAPMRAQIKEILAKTDFRRKVFEAQRELRTLLKPFPADMATLQSQIGAAFFSGDKKSLMETIANTVYEFDKMTVNRLRRLDRASMLGELKKIAAEFTTGDGIDEAKLAVPNIYLPCEYVNDGKYCKGRKLIIKENVLDSYIDILASDLINPIKYKYITSGLFTDNIIDYFQFETRTDEVITITKL